MDLALFFPYLPRDILGILSLCAISRSFDAGDFILQENEKGDSFFLIQEGEVAILKDQVQVGVVQQGNIIGESALTGDTRNASAKALGKVILDEISVSTLSKKLSSVQFSKLKNAIFEQLLTKLSKVNKVLTLEVKQRIENERAIVHMGRFIVYVLSLVFIYVFSIQVVSVLKLNLVSSSIISVPVLALFGSAMLLLMNKSGYPLSIYGFTLTNWRRSIAESFLITLLIISALMAVKWVLIHNVEAFSSLTLFHLSPALNTGASPTSHAVAALFIIVYALFVPIQEIIFRGAIQSSLQHFLIGKNKTLLAILVSNIPFCMIHFHLSLILVVLTYFLGNLWGWMYARQKTLVGVIFCHFFSGLIAFFVLGLQDLLIF